MSRKGEIFLEGQANVKINNIHRLSRKDKVYFKLKELTEKFLEEDFIKGSSLGFDAQTIGDEIGLCRNNVSKELNKLFNEKKAIKVAGKPVLYMDKESLEVKFNYSIKTYIFKNNEALINYFTKKEHRGKKYNENTINRNILNNIIGSKDSLKNEIEQAKAAILYPPNGLNMLICGETGVGKTTLVEILFRYAVDVNKLSSNAPFIIFNCADYAENPQLLISQLFGHVKGAFTGADKDKKGLVESADNGILFLDEVHRLPPEGQEMLFLLMDKGILRRLGESDNTRNVKVLLIMATTEEPNSSMLQTFLRRIPVTIKLPKLEDRTLKERMELIYSFFKEEARRIGAEIKVSKEVIKAFMLYKCTGNIGQLKSDVQLICAKSFLDYLTFKKEKLEVRLNQLPDRVRKGIFRINEKRNELMQCLELNTNEDIIFDGFDVDVSEKLNNKILADEYSVNEDFYEVINNAWKNLSKEDLSDIQRREKINYNIDTYFQNLFNKIKLKEAFSGDEAITKIISPKILNIVKEFIKDESSIFNKEIDQRIIYGLSLHINTLVERINTGKTVIYPNLEKIILDHPNEYEAAKLLRERIEKSLLIKIPETEISFLTMFLYAANLDKNEKNIGILVMCHGYTTASSMAQVANKLIDVEHAHAIDMPLEEKVDNIFEKALLEVKKINMGKGVLILTDMGSISSFGDIISDKTGIEIKTIEMVTTPMVIEATRKALIPYITLDMLYEDVISISQYIGKKQDVEADIEVIYDYELLKNYELDYYRKLMIDAIDSILVFMNAKKACDILNIVLENIAKQLDKSIDNSITTKFLFHCSCMLERVISKESIIYKSVNEIKEKRSNIFNMLKNNFQIAEETFRISIPDTEIAYILEIIDAHYDTLSMN